MDMTPYYPIIYVRGYAMSEGEINETTADPFCGFNLGSTVYRATPEKNRPPRKFIFESPVVRLASDFKYGDIYSEGLDIADDEWTAPVARRSILIYRYYDPASNLLGDGKTPPIEDFAKTLSELIAKVRTLVAKHPDDSLPPDQFKCYLVAHSMGGLVCRAMLQNKKLDPAGSAQYVDKFFTYATPHNGIEMAGINIPSWLTKNDIDNFSRKRMAAYLGLPKPKTDDDRVDWFPPNTFHPDRVFCLIGTNRSDYEVALGASRTFAGHGSDGLVRIENAWVCGRNDQGQAIPTAKAFVYRSHSGFFGIVNSEESYQNLTRFLFGDLRIDIWLDLETITLPAAIQEKKDAGKKVNALYQIELLASPRGKPWYLTRRVAEEDSVACLTQEQWDTGADRSFYLSTVFLSKRAKVDPNRSSLAYSVSLGVRVPDYEVDNKLWLDEHYEGGYLFRDSTIIELFPPDQDHAEWEIRQGWQSVSPGKAIAELPISTTSDNKMQVEVKVESKTTPGVRGKLRFVASIWT